MRSPAALISIDQRRSPFASRRASIPCSIYPSVPSEPQKTSVSWLLRPDQLEWVRQGALALSAEVRKFGSRVWPRLRDLPAPDSGWSGLRRELWQAFRVAGGGVVPQTPKRIVQIMKSRGVYPSPKGRDDGGQQKIKLKTVQMSIQVPQARERGNRQREQACNATMAKARRLADRLRAKIDAAAAQGRRLSYAAAMAEVRQEDGE